MKTQRRYPAVFLDRDGTILKERGYLKEAHKMKFYPFVFRALRSLQKKGFRLILITNQSGIGRGYFTRLQIDRIHKCFGKVLKRHGIKLAGIYLCPHHPRAGCSCRKPKPGLIKKAAKAHSLDVKRSYMIGDQLRDMRLSRAVNTKGVLVLTGAGRLSQEKAKVWANKVTSNLLTASQWILSDCCCADRRINEKN
ncbi:hypothetical protein BVX98_02745 [bacterium F11]|nr:hypothetical protein BVX98_02745 [bacterium F11]